MTDEFQDWSGTGQHDPMRWKNTDPLWKNRRITWGEASPRFEDWVQQEGMPTREEAIKIVDAGLEDRLELELYRRLNNPKYQPERWWDAL